MAYISRSKAVYLSDLEIVHMLMERSNSLMLCGYIWSSNDGADQDAESPIRNRAGSGPAQELNLKLTENFVSTMTSSSTDMLYGHLETRIQRSSGTTK